jgi:FtsP/CotA-like multicopper oxidase with cupredoxin domain
VAEVYESLEIADGLLAGAAVAGWAAVCWAVGALPYRASRFGRAVRRAIWVLALLGLVRLVLFGLMWTVDWYFAEPRVVVSAPLLVLPLAAVLARSVPGLRRLPASAGAPFRRAALDPWLVVPVQVCGLAALVGLFAAYVSRPVPSYVDDLGSHLGAVGLAAVLLAGLARWRREPVATNPRPAGIRAARAVLVVALVAVLVGGGLVALAGASRLPDRLPASHHDNHGGVGVESLTGPRGGEPDHRFVLTAGETTLRLTSGTQITGAWTYNGSAPGPELRVRKGELVEVTLVNNLRRDGVTIHWHGLDIPNAEDGVAGVTQNAVQPGGRHVYRFRPEQVGTFWYHTHQQPLWSVRRGLFGAIVVEPAGAGPAGSGPVEDIVVMAHEWRLGGRRIPAFGVADTVERKRVAPGTPVRLRLVNTDNNPVDDVEPRQFALLGTPFRVVAIDGADLSGPAELTGLRFGLATGARYDLQFVMPDRPVRLADLGSPGVSLVLTPDGGTGMPDVPADLPSFDADRYGTPAATPFGADSHFDRRFTQILDDRMAFYDGSFRFVPTINGKSFPQTPAMVVSRGDLVRVLIVNRSHQNHPMHLHGHHALVLLHNRRPPTGSPRWIDSLDLRPGESYEIGFRADNPGIWMDHCHNLDHAANGMVMHLAYEGVHSPFEVGRATVNQPE